MGFNTIETPGIPGGDENQKIDGLYRYLVRMADELNIQLGKIGSNDLTDEERQVMMDVIRETSGPAGQEAEYLDGAAQMESLKSLIVKTAKFVQTKLQEYRTSLLRETVAEGQFGRYVRNTGLDVIVNPEGVTQNFTFREIVQGLRNFEIFSKNYIKTGLLRTEGGLPVYGLQIGKDIVTFSEDGEETYHDGNKAIEVLADAINFFSGGNKVFYINAGKIHSAGDLEIESGKTLKIKSGAGMNVESGGNFEVKSGGALKVNSGGSINIDTSGTFKLQATTFDVESTNFKVSSTDKKVITGKTEINDTGVKTYVYNLPGGNNKYCAYFGGAAVGRVNPATLGVTNASELAVGFYVTNGVLSGTDFDFRNVISSNSSDDVGIRFGITQSSKKAQIYSLDGTKLELGLSSRYIEYAYIKNLLYTAIGQTSSRDIKHNIHPMEPVGEKLDQLEPVTFVYDDDAEEKKRFGLIYEDTVEVLPEICTGDESNKAINYVELIPMLLKEIQELRARVKALEERGGE